MARGPDRASRGALVADLLAGQGEYADPDQGALEDFNPFNLIVADRDRAMFLTNRPRPLRSLLAPGIYGVSNGTLDEPWPKTLRLKQLMLDWIVRDATDPGILLDGLGEDVLPDVGLRTAGASDVPQEPALSPIFIRNPVYGTRCSTVVAIDDKGDGIAIERRYGADGAKTGETSLAFVWPG